LFSLPVVSYYVTPLEFCKDIEQALMGVGYVRNGKYFVENGYNVDGMEISDEAINDRRAEPCGIVDLHVLF
jgi:hypothetical protein